MILQIFSACASESEPPNTVKSWLNTNARRPLMVPEPVTTPSPGMRCSAMPNSVQRCSTNMSISSNEPGSSRSSRRSRADNLPRLCCAAIRRAPPPARAACRLASSCSRISCTGAPCRRTVTYAWLSIALRRVASKRAALRAAVAQQVATSRRDRRRAGLLPMLYGGTDLSYAPSNRERRPERSMTKVNEWLEEIGLGRYAELFTKHHIDLDVLADLTESDLAQLGITLGDRKRLMRAITKSTGGRVQPLPAEASAHPAASSSAGAGREAERRQLTVMFCDMVGSTALSARMDPEDLHEVIRRYQGACAEVIGRFDGYIGHYIGDGILVYFGFPRAHEDDPRRAVQAGLEIIDAVQALNAETARPGVDIAVRVGINTGLVVAGDIGIGEFRDEMAVVGETPNVAARLQELAEPGTVLVGESTHRLVEGLFVFDELGPRTIKGIDDPIAVYRAREASGARSRFEATAIRGLTPLVGRDEELGLLLSRWNSAKEGAGQVVLLTGEPGIGKSRLIQAFRELVRADGVAVLRYFCSPFYVHSARHPIVDQLERAAQLKKSDPPEIKLDKLEALLSQGTSEVARAASLLAPLLSIPTGERYPPLELTPERKKTLALEALLEQLAGLASQPVLIILEDAHWIDPTSAELFHLMIERIQRRSVLALIAYRTGFAPPWTGFPHVTSLSLAHLSHRQTAALVEQVTRGRRLPPEVVDHIVTRTDGVPLYAEELTKTLLGSGALELVGDVFRLTRPLPSLPIPESLHDSLMARLDRLSEVKDVAHLAATLGRVFSYDLLAAVSLLDQETLDHALEQLADAELIYRRGAPPDAIYEFKHALVQDAAYNSLLRSKRLQIHRRAAPNPEERLPETVAA